MYHKIEKCPICDYTEFTNDIISEDFLLTHENFAIKSCKNCHFKFTNPRPVEEKLADYYQSEEYISHANKGTNIINVAYKIVRSYTINKKVDLINKLTNKGTVLDIGCGTGEFLHACKNDGWQIEGVEPSIVAKEKAEAKTGNKIFSELFDIPKSNKFNIISMWHVLEHLPLLNETMNYCKQILDKKGRMVIALPNNNSYDAQYYQDKWAAYDLPRHLYHFTPESFKKLIKKHGLILKDIKPMPFDAFYVSMLSEKYKNGKSNYLNSFRVGLKSNYLARKNKNFSSLIYIVKK